MFAADGPDIALIVFKLYGNIYYSRFDAGLSYFVQSCLTELLNMILYWEDSCT